MKVFIINNTASEMHHGCSRVMNNLNKLIRLNGGTVIGTSSVGLDWRKSESIKERMLESDIVIVNGEGSIHHDSPAGLPLLDVGMFCRPYGVRTALVNALFQDMTIVSESQLKAFDFISVRDSYSKKQIEQYGVQTTLLPDLTFYTKFKTKKDSIKDKKYWMYTCSVNIEKSVALYKASLKCKNNTVYEPVIYGRGDWELNVGRKSLFKKLKEMGVKQFTSKVVQRLNAYKYSKRFKLYSKTTLHSSYESMIDNIDFMVSGRFHSVCFAINSQVPFVALSSNSHKIEALIHDFGLSKERIVKSIDEVGSFKYLPYSDQEKENIRRKLSTIQSQYEIFFKSMFE